MCCLQEEATKSGERLPWHVNGRFDYPGALWKKASFLFSRVPLRLLPDFMQFADGICHRCNERLPYGHYAFSDRASGYFISHFRPYVNQACYALGMTPRGVIVLPDECPEWALEVDEKTRVDAAETEVRAAFGFPPKGVYRNQESTLWLLVREALPDSTIIRHYRPPWLKGLELDLYIEEFQIGIEFQGRQHSESFEYLGGEAALRKTRQRDKRKLKLCNDAGVTLLLFGEGNYLTDGSVHSLLRQAIPTVGIPPRKQVERPPHCFLVQVQGGTMRFDYHDEKNELSVSGKVGGVEVYGAGSIFDLCVACNHGRVTSLRFKSRNLGGTSFNISIPLLADEAQSVEVGGNTQRPMLDFFKSWSMFNPLVRIQEANEPSAPQLS